MRLHISPVRLSSKNECELIAMIEYLDCGSLLPLWHSQPAGRETGSGLPERERQRPAAVQGIKHGIKLVNSFDELVSTPFGEGVNALCWKRVLPGSFSEVVERLNLEKGITTVDEERLKALDLSDAGKVARDILLQDQEILRARDLAPVLDGINGYLPDAESGPMRTDVQSWHVDSATVGADTYLCTYHGASSEGLRNEDAVRRADIPETRAELLKLYGGDDDEGFLEYLNDNFFDLHYAALPHAQPFSFGVGNLWRVAIQYPSCPAPPCIHRAPATLPGESPRLLLIS